MKPFFYAVANNEGRPVMDEICCCESPDELADYFRDSIDNLTVKVVPVYTGPQIEEMCARLRRIKSEREELLASADRKRELLAARVRWLERKLVEVAEIIESQPLEIITDTIWHDSTETLCDALRRLASNWTETP